MTTARIWAVFAFGALALQFPMLAIADEAGLTLPYLAVVWLLLVAAAAWLARERP